MAKGAEG
jgi:hypothetical protein